MDTSIESDLDGAVLELDRWYADPMDGDAAEALLQRIYRTEQQAHSRGQSCGACPVFRMIARFWSGRAVRQDYDTLSSLCDTQRCRALVELVYGQLLISRKQSGALEHLRRGFALAAPYLAPADYFSVMRRHEQLAALALGDRPAPAQGLEQLLREAAVIRQLAADPRARPGGGGGPDTVG